MMMMMMMCWCRYELVRSVAVISAFLAASSVPMDDVFWLMATRELSICGSMTR